jgi:hypothetical protein
VSAAERPTAAFVLSLIGGIFILLGGGVRSVMRFYGYGMMNGYWGYGGMMGGYGWGGYDPGLGMTGYGYGGMFGLVGVLFGIVVIAGSLMLYHNPADHTKWGIVILIFSALSMYGSVMGGFGVGLILGIIGGILALTWKPPQSKS